MGNKGMYLYENLKYFQYEKVSIKRKVTSYYPFAINFPTKEEKEEDILIEVWICCNCGKEYSDNCDCKGNFEKKQIKISNK